MRQPDPQLQCLNADDHASEGDVAAIEARADADLILQTEVVDCALIGRFVHCHWDRMAADSIDVPAT